MALFFWLSLCAFIGYCADKKGRNMWAWGLAALFLSPIIVGIVLALMPDEDDSSSKHLSQSYDDDYSDYDFSGYKDSDDEYSEDDWDDDSGEEKCCPECGYIADADEEYCPRCGEMLW